MGSVKAEIVRNLAWQPIRHISCMQVHETIRKLKLGPLEIGNVFRTLRKEGTLAQRRYNLSPPSTPDDLSNVGFESEIQIIGVTNQALHEAVMSATSNKATVIECIEAIEKASA
uniref:Uncharacterized protein n=1 Tax=Tanacetum cinerariifolium TaxID=118510 RepID=A0A699JKH6_TANCI|nr:hypothetical protein CTI12_AA066870 [Tanacetum cinerariifolium]